MQQVITLVQNDAFAPHPIKRQLVPIHELFTRYMYGTCTVYTSIVSLIELHVGGPFSSPQTKFFQSFIVAQSWHKHIETRKSRV